MRINGRTYSQSDSYIARTSVSLRAMQARRPGREREAGEDKKEEMVVEAGEGGDCVWN